MADTPKQPKNAKPDAKNERDDEDVDIDALLDRRIEKMFRRFGHGTHHGISNSSDALVGVLGAVPAFAMAESMMSYAQATSVLTTNAVHQQNHLAKLGLLMTAEGAGELLRLHSRKPNPVWDDDEAE